MLEGEAPKNAPTFIGTNILVAQKALPKVVAKTEKKAVKSEKKAAAAAAATSAATVATEKRSRVYEK